MALPIAFQDEITAVNAGFTITSKTPADDPVATAGYDLHEWSYSYNAGTSTYTVLGGTDLACVHGAAALLDALGYRFWAPHANFRKRPASITPGLSAAKQKNWMPDTRIWQAYGHSFGGVYGSDATTLSSNMGRWQTLNGVANEYYPAGHRWASVITYAKLSAFWAANPHLLKPLGGAQTFDLSVTGADYDNIVHACAAYILDNPSAITAFNTTHFDPADGDGHPTETVWAFTAAVCQAVRAGTTSIGTISPLTGRPGILLGVYAYAGHRLPPDNDYSEYLYTQVALGFNSTAYSLEDLVAYHAEKARTIKLREYLDVMVWFMGQPISNGRSKSNYLTVYDSYMTAASRFDNTKKILGASCEFSGNWLVNLVMARATVLKCRTGTVDFAAVRDDLLEGIFGDDPAVLALYTLWGAPTQKWHLWNLEKSFDHVDAMVDGWYKTLFQRFMVILYEYMTLPNQQTAADNPTTHKSVDDPFWVKFPIFMAHVLGVRNDDSTHSYAWIRRLANSAPNANYPELRYANTQIFYDAKTADFTVGQKVRRTTTTNNDSDPTIQLVVDNGDGTGYIWINNDPNWADNSVIVDRLGGSATMNGTPQRPYWWQNPAAPTEGEFDTTYAAIQASAARDEDFDSDDLVQVSGLIPEAGGGSTEATRFYVAGSADYAFVGPGSVTKTGQQPIYDDETGEPTGEYEPISETVPYGPGLHRFSISASSVHVTHSGGRLYLDYFPTVRRDAGGTGQYWLYIPTRVAGQVGIQAKSRIRIHDAAGQHDIYYEEHPSYVSPANIGPGLVMVDDGNTSDLVSIFNAGRFLGMKKSEALVPRVFVEEDFPVRTKISAGTPP